MQFLHIIGQLCRYINDCIFYEMQVINANRQHELEEMKKLYPLGCSTMTEDSAEESFLILVDYHLTIDFSDWCVVGETFFLDYVQEDDRYKLGAFCMLYKQSNPNRYIPIPYMMP